jgi:hypothetical protein
MEQGNIIIMNSRVGMASPFYNELYVLFGGCEAIVLGKFKEDRGFF